MKYKKFVIYPNVKLGKNVTIEDYCIIGKSPRDKKPGKLKTIIGSGSVIRSHTVIYAGTKIGSGFQSGHGVLIREDNIIGNDVSIGTHSVLEFGNRIGNRVRIHSNCFLENVTIEDDVFIGPNTVFTDDYHPMKCPRAKECMQGATVKKLSKIGANCTFLPRVVVEKNSLVGAGSVVTKKIPENSVAVGNPAKVIKKIEQLKCFKGFFKRPYLWLPYVKERK